MTKTILWRSEPRQVEILTKQRLPANLFEQFIEENKGRNAVITLSEDNEKLSVILLGLEENKSVIAVRRFLGVPFWNLIVTRYVASIGV